MKCIECGKPFTPTNHGSPSKYCSNACRMRAYRRRRKTGEEPEPKRNSPPENQPPAAKQATIDKHEFERMMDGSMEDVLRHNRDRLQAALDSPDTRPQDLPAISRQLIAVCEKLENLSGGDPLLDDLEDDPMEVTADAGASIV